MKPIGRRMFLNRLAGLSAAAILPAWAQSAAVTPRQSAGPFYPDQLPLDDDNDLVHVRGQENPAQGAVTDLTGRVLDRNGRPLRNVRIEIWQCDANGRYRHSRDPGRSDPDPGFQGFGHTLSDQQGRYRFLTIKPVPYPGRTPHIHAAVFPPGERPFVTQLYVAGDPRNGEDFLFNRVPAESRRLVVSEFRTSTRAGIEFEAAWDLVLDVSRA